MMCACGKVGLYQVGRRAFCKTHHGDAVTAAREAHDAAIAMTQADLYSDAVGRPRKVGQLRRKIGGSKGGYGRFAYR